MEDSVTPIVSHAATRRSRPAAKKPTTVRKSAAKPAARPTKPASKAGAKTASKASRPAAKPSKVKKPKLVRDSFTIPKDEYAVLAELKQRCVKLSHPTKKSELLRAGIKALAGMSDKSLQAVLKTVPSIKTGRPSKV